MVKRCLEAFNVWVVFSTLFGFFLQFSYRFRSRLRSPCTSPGGGWPGVVVNVTGRSSTTALPSPSPPSPVPSGASCLLLARCRVALNQGATGGWERNATRGKTSVRRSAAAVGASALLASPLLRLVSSAPGRPFTCAASLFYLCFFNRISLVAACCFYFENRKTMGRMCLFIFPQAENNVHYFSQLLL